MPFPQPDYGRCKYCDVVICEGDFRCNACDAKIKTIKVVETDAPVADSRFMATFGDYDLDCLVGLGDCEESAIDDLMFKG